MPHVRNAPARGPRPIASPLFGHYFLFEGATLNEIIPSTNPDGTPSAVWTVIERSCSGACPSSAGQGVHGHFLAIPELGALALMAGYNSTTKDADIWLYHVAEVPEPGTWLQLAAGLAVLGGVAARRRIGSA